jgi:hypothetical protein
MFSRIVCFLGRAIEASHDATEVLLWYPGLLKIKIRIRDEHPASYFRELRKNFLG